MEIIVFFLGVLFILIGIRLLVKYYMDKDNKIYKAAVIECVEKYENIGNKILLHYDVMLEIDTDYGILRKTIRTDKRYNIGYGHEVYHDTQTDVTNFAKGYRKSKLKECWGTMGFGVMWCAFMGFIMSINISNTVEERFGFIIPYIIILPFVGIGIYGLILMPIKKRKTMAYCKIIQGKQVDYKEHTVKGGEKYYRPIYGFYYNGTEQTICSEISSKKSEYCQIGRPVNIIVNEKEGVISCEEDAGSERKMYLICGAVGMIFLILFMYAQFMDA